MISLDKKNGDNWIYAIIQLSRGWRYGTQFSINMSHFFLWMLSIPFVDGYTSIFECSLGTYPTISSLTVTLAVLSSASLKLQTTASA